MSFNIGLRWDFQAPVNELYNRLVNLNIGPNFTTESPVCATAAAGTARWRARPAIPIRWSVRITTNFSRASASHGVRLTAAFHRGARRLRDLLQHLGLSAAGQSDGAAVAAVLQRDPAEFAVSNPFTLANAFLTPAITATPQTYAIDPNFHIGYLHYWQASVQQNLSSSIVLTLTYQGNKGTHQVQEFLPNTFPAGSAAESLSFRLRLHHFERKLQLQRRQRPTAAPLPQRLLLERDCTFSPRPSTMRKGSAGARASAPPTRRTGSIFRPSARFRASTAPTHSI